MSDGPRLACDIRLGIEGMKMFMPPAKLGMHYYYSGLRATFNSSALEREAPHLERGDDRGP